LKSKLADASKPEQKQINELADLQAKQSLLRERLTQGLKPKENEEESERERSIRLGEMTPFGTFVSAQTRLVLLCTFQVQGHLKTCLKI